MKEETANLDSRVSSIDDLDTELFKIKRQFENIHLANEHCNNANRKLSWSQQQIASSVRDKMERVSMQLNEIKETLQIFKLYTIKDKNETVDIVQKLTSNGGLGRSDLLSEVRAMRQEISNLNLLFHKDHTNGGNIAIDSEPNSVNLIESTLELATREQLGEFFASRVQLL